MTENTRVLTCSENDVGLLSMERLPSKGNGYVGKGGLGVGW